MKPRTMYSSSINRSAIFFFFICLWSSVGSLPPTPRNIIEVQALMAIKSLLTDPLLVLQSWDTNSEDPCTWKGITCSEDAHTVTRLVIPSQHLSGTLPPSFVNLTNLEFIALQNNSISGRIPPELGKLPKLQNLDISMNNFSGEIPSELSNLGSLQNLRLNNNNLSGQIPPSLGTMAQLVFLDLSFNNLSPPLPKLHAATTRYVGNPLICPSVHDKECSIVRQRPGNSSVNNSSDIANTTERQQKSSKLGLALGTSLSCGFLLAVGCLVWWRRRQHNNQQVFFDSNDQQQQHNNLQEMSNFGNLRKFEFRELQKATNNFSSKNLVGKGGSGNVYKGYLRDGTVVAVKRLIRMNGGGGGGEMQFQTEVEMISLAVHRNLLKLLGFCVTHTGERLLVYPYMSNGSIASRLKAKPTLSWSTRKQIALGTARGLLYLHEQCDPKILHRDVKAANVLLDEHCEAVVGDFGLAKLLDHTESHVTTAVRGTAGHIAPEYLSTGQSSEKTDVFGFGVLLLELISGQRAIDFIIRNKPPLPNHHHHHLHQRSSLLDWVRKLEQEKKLEMLVDRNLNNLYDRSELEEMVQLALLCTQHHPTLRPNMSQVVRILQGNPHSEVPLPAAAAADQSSWTETSGAHDSLFSRHCASDLTDDSSLLVQDMELSGPR